MLGEGPLGPNGQGPPIQRRSDAADVICCSRLGVHASGQDHAAAAALLDQADAGLGKELRRLLGLKTKAGYSSAPSSAADQKVAGRASTRLVDAASTSR